MKNTKKKKKRAVRRLFRQPEIDKRLIKVVRPAIPYGISRQHFDKLIFPDEETRDTMLTALTILSIPLRALFGLHSVYEEMVVLYRMTKKYPWNERTVTRSQHLHFVWLVFVNLCYSFEERYKLFANAHNKALKSLSKTGGFDIKKSIKQIEAHLGVHIRKRGEQAHQWRRTHELVSDYNIIYLANSLKRMPEIDSIGRLYRMSALVLSIEIEQAIKFVEDFLIETINVHSENLLPLTRRINRTLKRLRIKK